MKKTEIILFMLLIASQVFPQQAPIVSMYDLNKNFCNPASTEGIVGLHSLNLLYRQQWTGFTNSPKTLGFNYVGQLSEKVGLGLLVINDNIGIFKQNSILATYSYQIPLNENDLKLSFGLSAGVLIYGINFADVTLQENDDPIIINQNTNVTLPDADFGLYLYQNEKYFLGASAKHLFENKIKFNKNIPRTEKSKLYRHYCFMGGYSFELPEDIDLETSVAVNAVRNSPALLFIGVRGKYKYFNLGIAYRSSSELIPSIGIVYNNFVFGYSYDISFSELKNYHSNTHEIVLGFRFMKNKQAVPLIK